MTDSVADLNGRVTRLIVYPVKSCAGVDLQHAVLTETGLDLDRAWMVVDEAGVFVSQRELPRMALIKPQLRHYDVILRAPGMLALHLTIDAVEEPVTVRVWDDQVKAYDMGDLAAQWFSDFLGRKLRLVRFDPEYRRLSSLKWTDGFEAPNQFSDGYPLLVLSEASLNLLNEKLLVAGEAAVGLERFRPNIVVSDFEAHDEDRVGMLRLTSQDGAPDAVWLRPVKPCPRCPIPNIDPATASSSPVVVDMLGTYRQDDRVNGAITFGMNAIVIRGADQTLYVGQAVKASFDFA